MFISILILIITILITLLELPHIMKSKLVKEGVFFLLILSLGTFFSILLALDIHFPNPINWLTIFIKPLSNWLYHYL
ncbi:hypothetical protein J2Y02_000976 [Neobacillus drentensis]|nr:hypothetical protein [Neobacillus drentensis]